MFTMLKKVFGKKKTPQRPVKAASTYSSNRTTTSAPSSSDDSTFSPFVSNALLNAGSSSASRQECHMGSDSPVANFSSSSCSSSSSSDSSSSDSSSSFSD